MKTKILLLLICIWAVPAHGEERCLRDAWDAYNKGAYTAAMQAADRCIADFHLKADREQSALVQRGEAQPPTGAVTDSDKQKIFARGILNDTAAAYFVRGRSAEALANRRGPKAKEYQAEAKAAYADAKKLTYARVWDPQGWFWSPSETAADRLVGLK